MSFVRRRPIFIAVAAGVVALLVTGVAYAEGVFGDPDHGPVIRATAGPNTSDLAPVAGTARVVAHSDHATLYRSPAKRRGAVCLWIGPGKEAACVDRLSDDHWPLGVYTRVVGDRQVVFGLHSQ